MSEFWFSELLGAFSRCQKFYRMIVVSVCGKLVMTNSLECSHMYRVGKSAVKGGCCMAGVRFKDFMVHIVVGAGLLVMLSACQSSKHAEVIGTEQTEGSDQGQFEEPMVESSLSFPEPEINTMDGARDSDLVEDFGYVEETDSGMITGEERTEHDGADFGLSHIFFDFDRYAIRSDAVPMLEANARILKNEHQDADVLIEGHCDERGTVEYNLELGKRRAQSVKDYLVDLGVQESRIRIVSYGKERPFCTESEPSCWAQNRRGHFLLKK